MRFSSPRIASIAALGLLAFMLVLAWGAERRESVTPDEVPHIGAGLSYIQKLDLRLNEEHPPLSKVLAAIPLVATGVRADYTGPVWTHSSAFFAGLAGEWIFGSQVVFHWNDPRRTLTLARIPMMLLTLALGWCVFHFARLLGGDLAGILCLAVYVSTPMFLAEGPLVLTDMALALFALLAVWTFASLWQDPTRRNVVLFSMAMAAAILSKFSAGLIFFALGVFVAISLRWPISAQPISELEARKWRKERLRATFRGVLLSASWVYVFFLVFSWNQPMDIPGLSGTGWVGATIGRILMPPWVLVRGAILFVVMAGRSSYILGHEYWHGVWFYFPVLLVLKSAPGFLGLLALAAVMSLRTATVKHAEEYSNHRRILWVTCALFGGICILSHFNIDFRHFSFPVTLLILMLSTLPRGITRLNGRVAQYAAAIVTLVLAISCLVTAVRAYPFYIPYISAFGMGRPAWKLVSGGNLDWNQSLSETSSFARTHDLKEIQVAPSDLAEIGGWAPEGRLWNCQDAGPPDARKWVVVSANKLIPGRECAWLSQYPQEVLAGGSLFAIHLPEAIPAPGSSGRPVGRSAPLRVLGLEQDLESTYISLLNHPETFPVVLAPFEAAMAAKTKMLAMRFMKILRLT